jgi:hypothetical protein
MLIPKSKTVNQLMKNQLLLGGTILCLGASSVWGADTMKGGDTMNNPRQTTNDDQGGLYRANELSVDMFGTASLGKYSIEHISNNRIRHNTRLGAGLGLSYFITRNLGIGAEAYSENTTGPFIDSASANLTLRLPLGGSGVAPYVFGGGGQQFDLAKFYFGQAGVGVEYRFTPRFGMFVDARCVVPNETKYYGVGRLGVRFAF